MEKTIKIDGKDIKLKSNAMLPLIYRGAFGEDIFAKQASIFNAFKLEKVERDGEEKEETVSDYTKIDSLGVMRVVWCMAKCADKNIPEFEKWLEEFEAFPVMDVLGNVGDMFYANMASITKIKN